MQQVALSEDTLTLSLTVYCLYSTASSRIAARVRSGRHIRPYDAGVVDTHQEFRILHHPLLHIHTPRVSGKALPTGFSPRPLSRRPAMN